MARQALAVARDNPEVLRAAGFALAALAGENETALTALDRAIELNPNYALAYAQRGLVLVWLNRPDEAIAAAERAIRLSPNDPTIFELLFRAGPRSLGRRPLRGGIVVGRSCVGQQCRAARAAPQAEPLGHLGRREEASECLQRLRETYPEPTVAAVMRDVAKGMSPEVAARIAEGLRKAGLPEG